MIDLDRLVEGAGRHAKRLLVDEQVTSLSPFFHLVATPPAQDALVLCIWRSEREKIDAIAKTRELAHKIDAQACLFLGEAWMVVRAAPTPWHSRRVLEQSRRDPPSQQPDRKECVVASATDGERTSVAMWEILRSSPGGSVVALESMEMPEHAKFQGRMVEGILPHRKKKENADG